MKRFTLLVSLGLITELSVAQTEDPNKSFQDQQDSDLEETLVIGSRKGDFTIITEDTQKLVETAGSLGDPMSAIFSLPGVVYSSGDGGEPAVRGSSPEDNTFIVDFLPTSYIFHEFGVSIFSEFIVQDFQLYSAGFGPEYAGVTGAAFDITLRQPKKQDLSTTLDISMLRSGIFLEGGVTENSAFYASGRLSLIDKFISADDASDDGVNVKKVPQDFDYQFKYSWDVNANHRLNVSASGAGDKAAAEFTEQSDFARSNPDFSGDAELETKFDGQNLLWEYYGDNQHEFKLGVGTLKDEFNVYWGDDYINEVALTQTTAKGRYRLPVNKNHKLTIGFQQTDYSYDYKLDQIHFVCTEFDPSCNTSRRGRLVTEETFDLIETTAYINETWMPTDTLTFDIGLQWHTNDFSDEEFTHPRLAISYELNPNWTVTSKAGQYNRFADLNTVVSELGNPNLKSPTSNHYTLGVTNTIMNGWSWTLESYYKTLEELPLALSEEDNDADLYYINGTEGTAQGFDLLINKDKTDNWYTWVSLSYGKSERTNTQTNETVEYRLDTPLIFNWVLNYEFTSRFSAGWRWTVRSGAAYTPIVDVQENPYFDDAVLPVYGEPFSDRLPLYNRLDLRFTWDTSTPSFESALIIDIINATNYENVSDRTLDYDKVNSPDDEVKTVDEVGIGFQPAITYRMSF